MARPMMRWSQEMLDALVRLRRAGNSYIECADRIGVCAEVIAAKCKELGLNQKMNRGFIPGTQERRSSEYQRGYNDALAQAVKGSENVDT